MTERVGDGVGVRCGGRGGSFIIEETSANPHHGLFLTHNVCNYETCTHHASQLGKNVWENHVLKLGDEGG